jgi:hypothetical protein
LTFESEGNMPVRPVKKRYGRAKRVVFPPILAAVKMRAYPFHQEIVQDAKYLPKDIVWGSREHLLYLFFLNIYMKGGINSAAAIISLSRFYAEHSWAFMPENILALETWEHVLFVEWLGWVLPQYGLGVNITEAKWHWFWNGLKLAKFWASNPLNLFSEVQENAERTWQSYRIAKHNYAHLCRRIIRKQGLSHEQLMESPNGFYGFQHKMVSMIAYFYVHAGAVKPFAYPVPVDFHILRVLIATGILTMRGMRKRAWQYREKFLPYAREVTLRYIVETGEDTQLLAEGLWLLSRTLCRWHPGNKSSVEKSNRARRRVITDTPFVWTAHTERLYDKSCAICPVEDHCKWNIPSSYYYVKGVILVREARSRPDNTNRVQAKLFDVTPMPPHQNGHVQRRSLPVLEPSLHPSLFE